MSTSPDEFVNVLILGGLTHVGRALLCFLVNLKPRDGDDTGRRKVKHIRIADKFLVSEETSTVYVDPDTIKALQDDRVEYRQTNLTMPHIAAKVFDGPDGEVYDIIFDLTGEGVLLHDVPSELLLERTTKLAASLGREAAKRNVKAYVRDTPAFWKTKTGGKALAETDVVERGEADTPRSYYYYEAERAVANVENLPLVILRSANIYGPHQYFGTVTPKIALGEIYAYLQEPMRLLWSENVRANTLHVRDWCQAAWSAALWAEKRSRTQANEEAGVLLPYISAKKDKSRILIESEQSILNDDLVCPKRVSPVAPVFHLADNDDVTKGRVLSVIGEVFNIQTGFTNAAINAWARFNLASVVDDSNEKHATAMADLAEQQGIKNNNSPLTCFLGEEDVAPRAMHFDSSKAQRVLQWKPKETYDARTVKEVVTSFKDAGVWVSR